MKEVKEKKTTRRRKRKSGTPDIRENRCIFAFARRGKKYNRGLCK
nr:MAG TPA: hypothetical protein [Caudoviricetes sp.]